MQTACVVILLFVGLVFSAELISDPGLLSLAGNQCSGGNVWHFRSDYVWNDTQEFINARCAAYFELPTAAIPGVTKGNQTNINHAIIPPLPTVTGGMGGWPSSAAVVDMNTACRASLWAPFTIPSDNAASVMISLKLWVRSNDQIQQFLLPDGSLVPGADLLQYLPQPYGLLGEDLESFPPLVEETNQVRIDIMAPAANNDFYDEAFSLIPAQIQKQIPISNWVDGDVVPANGTNGNWIQVTYDATHDLTTAGTYALRIASAQSQIGVSWGVSDVHVTFTAGARRRRSEGMYEVESASEEILGSFTHILPARMGKF